MPIISAKLERNGAFMEITCANSYLRFRFPANIAPIGSGGMGEVYVGRNQNGAPVAIKRVHPHLLHNYAVVQRAAAEGSFQYAHPALIEMQGAYGVYGNGQLQELFIISKYVEGRPLPDYISQVVNKRNDRVVRICKLMYPVMDALSFLHNHNLVHLDIKPSNMMIEADKQVKLMDLGITTMAGDAYDTGKKVGMVGTPAYAAPEQTYDGINSNLNVDARADIYAMGITLAELLGGSVPERSDNGSLKLSKHIPRGIAKVIRNATYSDRDKRYDTIADMKKDLQKGMTQKPFPWTAILIGVAVFIAFLAVLSLYITM